MHPPESPHVRYTVNKDNYSEIMTRGSSVTGAFHAEYNWWDVELGRGSSLFPVDHIAGAKVEGAVCDVGYLATTAIVGEGTPASWSALYSDLAEGDGTPLSNQFERMPKGVVMKSGIAKL